MALINILTKDLDFLKLILLFNILIFGSFFQEYLFKYCFNLTQTYDVSNNVAIYGAGDAGLLQKIFIWKH